MRYIILRWARVMRGLLNALLSGRDNPILRGIELDETIPILTRGGVKEQLLKSYKFLY